MKNILISPSRVVTRPRSAAFSPYGTGVSLALWPSVLPGRHGFVEYGRTPRNGIDARMCVFPAIQMNAQVKGADKRLAKGPHPWRRS